MLSHDVAYLKNFTKCFAGFFSLAIPRLFLNSSIWVLKTYLFSLLPTIPYWLLSSLNFRRFSWINFYFVLVCLYFYQDQLSKSLSWSLYLLKGKYATAPPPLEVHILLEPFLVAQGGKESAESGISLGEGNGYPFQYSCLEDSMVRGVFCMFCNFLFRFYHSRQWVIDSYEKEGCSKYCKFFYEL